MSEILSIVILGLIAFTTADYTLKRCTVKDPVAPIIAAVFAVLVCIFLKSVL